LSPDLCERLGTQFVLLEHARTPLLLLPPPPLLLIQHLFFRSMHDPLLLLLPLPLLLLL